MADYIKQGIKRLFLVGCPRSGTTLLQSMIAAHPKIVSLPETHFFSCVSPSRRIMAKLGMTNRYRLATNKLLEIGCNKRQIPSWPHNIFIARLTEAFVSFIDNKAHERGAEGWLEKTPNHLHYIDTIERFVPGVSFIHIIREGRDVIAFLYDITHRYPERWGGRRDLDKCLNRWIKDVQISLNAKYKTGHYFILYEKLIETPDTVLKELCQCLEVKFDTRMLEQYQKQYKSLRLPGAEWTDGVNNEISKSQNHKIYRVLTEQQRELILESIRKLNLEKLQLLFPVTNCCQSWFQGIYLLPI